MTNTTFPTENNKTYNITREIAERTHRRRIRDAFARNELTIVVTDDGVFNVEKCDSDSIKRAAIKETLRIHPEYTYCGDVADKE